MRKRRIMLVGAVASVIVAMVQGLGWLGPAERWVYDVRARRCQFFLRAPTDQLIHVDIDDGSIEEMGRWPWPRSTMADVIGELDAAGARVIGLDVLFVEPSLTRMERRGDGTIVESDDDALLEAAIKKSGKVILGGERVRGPRDLGVLPRFADAAMGLGFTDWVPMDEGILRQLPAVRRDGFGKVALSADLRLACAALGVKPDEGGLMVEDGGVRLHRAGGGTDVIVPLTWSKDGVGLMQAPVFGTAGWSTAYDVPAHREIKQHVPIIRVYEAAELRHKIEANNRRGERVNRELEQKLAESRRWVAQRVKDRVVLIGWVATGTTDFVPTSVHPYCPGVVVRGMAINGMMTGELWRRTPWWADALATIGMGILMTWIAMRARGVWTVLWAVGMCGLYVILNGLILFDWGNLIVGVIGPVVAVGVVAMIVRIPTSSKP